jgi:hypothetical protein
MVVDAGPRALSTPSVNTAFVTVTVCMPDGKFDNCQNIDHIEVDTGSSGLRIVTGATTVNSSGTVIGTFNLPLPAVADPARAGNVLAECLQFADGFSWGSVNTADMKLQISGKTATNVVVHMIGAASAGDPSKANPTCLPPPPLNASAQSCYGVENTVPCFGANGILGVGPFLYDCTSAGNTCDPLPTTCTGGVCYPGNSAAYFSCTATATPSCAEVGRGDIGTQLQVSNPAARFASDYNGVILELPTVGTNGAAAGLKGSLVFGIDSQSNNQSSGVTKLFMDGNGAISATLSGSSTQYPVSYLDSGSNANFYPTTSVTSCKPPDEGFLCPPVGTTVSESATLQGIDQTMKTADFSIVNASDTLFPTGNAAFSNLAGSNYVPPPWPNNVNPNTTLDLGLSFFFGQNVFTGFENNASGPYFAY